MNISDLQSCRKPADGQASYYCPLLEADRAGQEEEICSLCSSFGEQLQRNRVIQAAFLFAREAHRGQFRKGTDIPYLIHLIRTWGYVSRMTENETELAAALLHDVLEDTSVTREELAEQFGGELARLVDGESECKRENRPASETWELRKRETIERLHRCAGMEHTEAAMHIAFGDKLANLYSMMFEYRQAGDRLWRKFNQKSKERHAWYYGELGRIFQGYFTGREAVLVREYMEYYREVFNKNEIQGRE